MLVFSRIFGPLRRVHLLWCLIWAQAAQTASAEWRLEQRTIVDGQPGQVTAQSSGLGYGNGWADAGVGSSPDSAATQRTDLFANAEAWDFSIFGEIQIAQYASGMLYERYRWYPSPGGSALGEIEEYVDLGVRGSVNLLDAACAGEALLRLEYTSSLPVQNGGPYPMVEINEGRTTEAAGSYTLGIPDLASISGSYHQKEGRYPLFPTTGSPQTWSNGGCALVYWRRHAGAVRAIAWANGDYFDDAESEVHLDGLLVSTIQKRPCPQ